MGMMMNPFVFLGTSGGGGPPPTSTQWRLNLTAKQSAGAWYGPAEVQFRGVAGGPDLATGGTADASAFYAFEGGFPPSNAFDDNTSTRWLTGNTGPNHWLRYTKATAYSVVEVVLTAASSGGDMPTAFDVQFWDGSAWVTYYSVTTPATWVSGETRVFTKP